MNTIHAKAFAKINLTLDVLGKMSDGYHEMLMVMQSVSLCDDIDIRLTDDGLFSARTNLSFLPEDSRNIAVKAAELFFSRIGDGKTGAELTIQKHIPVCAGLAGGSSDAAAVLLALNKHTGAGMGREELLELAGRLGSDVPFCLTGGTALAEGRGEILTKLPPMPECSVIIAKPSFGVSTAELFGRLRCGDIKCRPDTAGMTEALRSRDFYGIARRCFNIFEEILPREYAEVFEIKNALLDGGAAGVCMSGTGPSVFGLFPNGFNAEAAAEKIRKTVDNVFVCEPANGVDL